jgi:Gas vesicle synthesis protein GvpL/GvpF
MRHREVLSKLVEQEDVVLPMRFGSIADSAEEIERVISSNHDTLAGELERLSGKVEMGLRVNWTVPNIFEYMLTVHPELREMRDRIFSGGQKPPQSEMVELGREFERIQNEDRETHTTKVEQLMTPRCVEVRRAPVRNEKEVMNLAFLIEKARRDEYEKAVHEAADSFDDNFFFEYSGPWAPSTFAELNLRG